MPKQISQIETEPFECNINIYREISINSQTIQSEDIFESELIFDSTERNGIND